MILTILCFLSLSVVFSAVVVKNLIPMEIVKVGVALDFTFSGDTFEQSEFQAMSYSVRPDLLPEWLSFNGELRQFTGTPQNGDEGKWSIPVVASDLTSEIHTLFRVHVLHEHIQMYLPLDSDTADISGNSLDATIEGNDDFLYLTPRTNCKGTGMGSSGCLYFEGRRAAYLKLDNGALDGLSDFTVAFFAYVSDFDDPSNRSPSFISATAAAPNDENNVLFLSVNPVEQTLYMWDEVNGGATYNVGRIHIPRNEWMHWILTREGTTIRLYVNGEKFHDVESSGVAVPLDVSGCLVFGNDQDALCGSFEDHQTFQGYLDDLFVLNRFVGDDEAHFLAKSYHQRNSHQIVLSKPPPTQYADIDIPFEYILPENTFSHSDYPSEIMLHYTAGVSLPPWLQFDGTARRLYGTPSNDDIGRNCFFVVVSAADSYHQSNNNVELCVVVKMSGLNAYYPIDMKPIDKADNVIEEVDASGNGYNTLVIDTHADGVVYEVGRNKNNNNMMGMGGNSKSWFLSGTIADKVRLPTASLDGLTSFTIAVWVKFADVARSYHSIIHGTSTGGNDLYCGVYRSAEATHRMVMWFTPSPYYACTPQNGYKTYDADRWYHLVWTRDAPAGSCAAYLDGELQCEDTTCGNAPLSISGAVVVGQEQDAVYGGFSAEEAMHGHIDELMIFDRALSGEEIRKLARIPDPIITVDESALDGVVDVVYTNLGEPFSFSIPNSTFTHSWGNQFLTFSVPAIGGGMPHWMAFDPVTQELSGTPTLETDIGRSYVVIFATDGFTTQYATAVIHVRMQDMRLYYSFQTSYNDFSGNEMHAEAHAMPSFYTAPCMFGQRCVTFSPVYDSQYIRVPMYNNKGFDGLGTFSISLWLKLIEISGDRETIISIENEMYVSSYVRVSIKDGVGFRVELGGTRMNYVFPSFFQNFRHLTIVRDWYEWSFYVDGVFVGSEVQSKYFPFDIPSTYGAVIFGSEITMKTGSVIDAVGNHLSWAQMQDVRVFDSALSTSQIEYLAATSMPNHCHYQLYGGGPSKCTKCEDEWFLLNGECVQECHLYGSFYNHPSGKCLECTDRCVSCSFEIDAVVPRCHLCEYGFYLREKECVYMCNGDFPGYPSSTEGLCCPLGTKQLVEFPTDPASECEVCPIGTYGSYPPTPQCNVCPLGTWTEGIQSQNISMCLPCAHGTYGEDPPSDTCIACSLGSYTENEGSANISLCLPCDFGKYGNDPADGSCSVCSSGTYTVNQGSTDETDCISCPVGTWSAVSGSSCTPCGMGFYNPNEGSETNVCAECPVGTWSNEESVAECTPCGSGRFNPDTGSSSNVCEDCPVGTWSEVSEAESCVDCGIGKYNPDTASSSNVCEDCPLGTWSDGAAVGECTECGEGYFLNAVGSSSNLCEECQPGSWSDVSAVGVCTECEAGYYNPNNGSVSVDDCLDCPVGTWSDISGASSCQDCGPGKFNSDTGSSSSNDCQDCPAGKWSSAQAASICEDCPAGTWNSQVGSSDVSDCTFCASGYWSSVEGATSDSVCQLCTSGEHTTNGFSNGCGYNCCQPCPEGSIGTDPPSGTCKTCEDTCQQCSVSMDCEECKSNYYLYDTGIWVTCLDDCTQYENSTIPFYNVDASGGSEDVAFCERCQKTLLNCAHCENGIECLRCNTDYYLHYTHGRCFADCSTTGRFHNDATTDPPNCSPCRTGCVSCEDNGGFCTECDLGLFTHLGECIDTCPPTFYEDLLKGSCESCTDNCEVCTKSENCDVKCSPGYYLHAVDNQCYADCSAIEEAGLFYNNADNVPPVCSPCSNLHCDVCQMNGECTLCDDSHYLAGTVCVESCNSPGFFPATEGRECRACVAGCTQCVNEVECEECFSEFFLYTDTEDENRSKCTDRCNTTGDGFFFNDVSQSPPSCQSCNRTRCNFCSYLDGECIGECRSGHRGSADCKVHSCDALEECNENGECIASNVCRCDSGYTAASNCSAYSCSCIGQHVAEDLCVGPNTCDCKDGWKGENEDGFVDCTVFSCELRNECSGNGVCSGANSCVCEVVAVDEDDSSIFGGWKGANCDIPACRECNGQFEENEEDIYGVCVGPDICNCTQPTKRIGETCSTPVCWDIPATDEKACNRDLDDTNRYKCKCSNLRTGEQCELGISDLRSLVDSFQELIGYVGAGLGALIVVVGILAFLIFLLLLMYRKKLRKRNLRIIQDPELMEDIKHDQELIFMDNSERVSKSNDLAVATGKLEDLVKVGNSPEIVTECNSCIYGIATLRSNLTNCNILITNTIAAILQTNFEYVDTAAKLNLLKLFDRLIGVYMVFFKESGKKLEAVDENHEKLFSMFSSIVKVSKKVESSDNVSLMCEAMSCLEALKNVPSDSSGIKSVVTSLFKIKNTGEMVNIIANEYQKLARKWWAELLVTRILSYSLLGEKRESKEESLEKMFQSIPASFDESSMPYLSGLADVFYFVLEQCEESSIRNKVFTGLKRITQASLRNLIHINKKDEHVHIRGIALERAKDLVVNPEMCEKLKKEVKNDLVQRIVLETDEVLSERIKVYNRNLIGDQAEIKALLEKESGKVVEILDSKWVDISCNKMTLKQKREEMVEFRAHLKLKEGELKKIEVKISNAEKGGWREALDVLGGKIKQAKKQAKYLTDRMCQGQLTGEEERKLKGLEGEIEKFEEEMEPHSFKEMQLVKLEEKRGTIEDEIGEYKRMIESEDENCTQMETEIQLSKKVYEKQVNNLKQIEEDYQMALQLQKEMIAEKNARLLEGKKQGGEEMTSLESATMEIFEGKKFKEEVPNEFICPIGLEIMDDPVILIDSGLSYDKNNIDMWLSQGGKTDPVTGKSLKRTEYVTNFGLRHAIEQWTTKHKL